MSYLENTDLYQKNRKYLKDLLMKIKETGLQVFIANNPLALSAYGLVTDGRDLIGIQYDRTRGIQLSYNYVPSRDCGSGCDIRQMPVDTENREWFDNAAMEGKAAAYGFGAQLLQMKYKDPVKYYLKRYESSHYVKL